MVLRQKREASDVLFIDASKGFTKVGGIPNHEIDFLEQYWTAFPQLRSVLFAADETPYSRLAVENIKEAIEGSADVQAFVAAHQSAFADFDTYLDGELIGK